MSEALYDVIIVGGGPAGLSAALMLGRCRRRVLVCDAGPKRNDGVPQMWGFLSRDGIAPQELLRVAREQLLAYPQVTVWTDPDSEVVDVKIRDGNLADEFEVLTRDGRLFVCRKLLLATGVTDDVPRIEGIDPLYGKSVHHCPYCHGWEVRDKPIVVYGKGEGGVNFALELTLWSSDVTLCTDGQANLDELLLSRLRQSGIPLREESIHRLQGTPDGRLRCVEFASGESVDAHALFFTTGWRQRSDLAARLGCPRTDKGSYETIHYEATCIPGVYVAGDASPRVHFAVVAAAEGTQAAFAINTALLKEDLVARERYRAVEKRADD